MSTPLGDLDAAIEWHRAVLTGARELGLRWDDPVLLRQRYVLNRLLRLRRYIRRQ